ncbi:MAG: hypothetical protein ABR550_12015 [Wenzhouxiangellaceae bacterium]
MTDILPVRARFVKSCANFQQAIIRLNLKSPIGNVSAFGSSAEFMGAQRRYFLSPSRQERPENKGLTILKDRHAGTSYDQLRYSCSDVE